jgi:hypothetical protein
MTDQPAVGTALCERYAVADVDSHVIEPPDLWTSRISSTWGDLVPHVKVDRRGEQHRFAEAVRRRDDRAGRVAGVPAVEMKRAYEMGHKGVLFAARYDKIGLPRLVDDYWEPLLGQAQEMGLSMKILHIIAPPEIMPVLTVFASTSTSGTPARSNVA